MHLMKNFIKSSNISLSSSSIDEILKDFSQKSMQFSLSFIKELSKETLLELYPYFYKYKDVFNINDTIIDEMRNILKNKIYKLYFMMFKQNHSKCLSVSCGEKVFEIPISQLFIKPNQIYTLFSQGISKINTKNLFDVSKKKQYIYSY